MQLIFDTTFITDEDKNDSENHANLPKYFLYVERANPQKKSAEYSQLQVDLINHRSSKP